MSDSDDDIQIVHELEEKPAEQAPQDNMGNSHEKKSKKGGVYKAPRDDDKRRTTSKMNIEKARMVRNFKLNEQKKKKMEEQLDKLNQVEIKDEESESEDEIFLTKKSKKQKPQRQEPAQQTYQNERLDRIEGILTKLARKHKPQKEDRKTIIQLQQQQPQEKKDDELTKQFKSKLLLKL
jgi:hypothetical protein